MVEGTRIFPSCNLISQLEKWLICFGARQSTYNPSLKMNNCFKTIFNYFLMFSLQQAVAIINQIPVEKLSRLLLRILASLHSKVNCARFPNLQTPTFTTEERERLEGGLELNAASITLLLDTITFFFETVRYFFLSFLVPLIFATPKLTRLRLFITN
jgi:hypothetical protein